LCITAAYKHADGKKIDGRRVLVDVERARTVKGWLPRRLGMLTIRLVQKDALLLQKNNQLSIFIMFQGGGLGGTRRGGPDVNIKHSGREDNERERERYRLERERESARGGNPDRDRIERDRPDRDRRRTRSRDRERIDRDKRRKSRRYHFSVCVLCNLFASYGIINYVNCLFSDSHHSSLLCDELLN
jgi:U1 small nuclear ribonucleoprotein